MLIQLFNVVAVILFVLTAVACTTPTVPPEPTTTARTERVETAVPPTAAAPTLAPTPTLTAAELRDRRATAVLTTLPGYDPAQHEALLPLARALWGDEYVVDPADVTLVVGETAVQVNADAAYPSDTLFVWSADSHLRILTGQPDTTIKRGQVALGAATLNTWVRYNVDGNVLEFVDPAGNWISPLGLQEDGRFTFYTKAKIGPNGERELTSTIWWTNGGTPVEIATSPETGLSLTDFLAANAGLQLTQTEGDNGRHLVALIDADTQELRYILDDGGNWALVEQVADRYVIPEPIYEPLVFHVSSDADRTPAISRTLPPGVTQYVDRLYTSAEMTQIFRDAGFEPTEGLACSQIDGYRYNVAGVIVGFGNDVVMRIGNNDVVTQTVYWLTCGRDNNGKIVPLVLQIGYHNSHYPGDITLQDLNGKPITLSGKFNEEKQRELIGRMMTINNLGSVSVTNRTDMFVLELVNPFTNGSQALSIGQLPSPVTNLNPLGHLALTGAIIRIDNRR